MDDKPIDRRRFFRHGLRELINPLSKAIAPLEKMANQLGKMEAQLAKPAKPSKSLVKPAAHTISTAPVWLRPPGALAEAELQTTCTKSGECVNVCPAKCISIDPAGKKGNGLPVIDINHMPCVVCDGLYCMYACPTGALVPTALADIDMGTAQWRESTCVRSHGPSTGSGHAPSTGAAQAHSISSEPGPSTGADDDCVICIDRCPLGSAAIELKDGKIHVIEDGCIGCGVCEHACPTTPKSIVVIPKAARSVGGH